MPRPKTLPIRELRTRLGTGNYSELARRTGLTPQHVSRVLRGVSGISFWTATRIADAAGVSMNDLRVFIAPFRRELGLL